MPASSSQGGGGDSARYPASNAGRRRLRGTDSRVRITREWPRAQRRRWGDAHAVHSAGIDQPESRHGVRRRRRRSAGGWPKRTDAVASSRGPPD